ncbi:galactose mutarotase [candidate division KSB1 bacterium]|nr:galactose mutarotase [candidate division KSB1 bacterium]
MKVVYLVLPVLLLLFVACQQPTSKLLITQQPYGTLQDGTAVEQFTLTNVNGMTVKIINFGAIITDIIVSDKAGKLGSVVLGYNDLAGYEGDASFYGAIVGRYANRIAKGKFTLDGVEYTLATNNPPNALHGGPKGFYKKVWTAAPITTDDHVALALSYVSPDGEEGYPGQLKVKLIYSLNNDNELKFDFQATTDKKTVVNLTGHSYFNLKDAGRSTILNHELMIPADWITPVDETLIPTGELMDVTDTPFDFRQITAIGARINEDNTQLKYGQGYDHNWVLNGAADSLKLGAKVVEPESGRVMEILTTMPAIQFYSGNFINGTITGKEGFKYEHRTGLCLEPQYYPDSPNHPGFPSTVLEPGQEYSETIIYRFSTM